jgi:hypothetical protein
MNIGSDESSEAALDAGVELDAFVDDEDAAFLSPPPPHAARSAASNRTRTAIFTDVSAG